MSLGILLLMLGTVAVASAGDLFRRPLWLDEYHTLFLARQPSFERILDDLARGSDTNPPLLYVLVRAVSVLSGDVDALALRLVAFGSTWLAIVVTYLSLRRHVVSLAAFAAAMSIWAHPLVAYYAFDGRFYAPLLFFSVLFAWSASETVLTPQASRKWQLVMAVASVALCTIHYFGIFVWTLVGTVAIVAVHRRGENAGRLLPALAGPLVLLACVPIYLGQRAAFAAETWVPPVSGRQLWQFLGFLFAWPPLWFTPLLGLAWHFFPRRQSAADVGEMRAGPSRFAMAHLLVLGFLPGVLIAFSLLVQPVLVPRYAIPAVLVFAPMTAMAVLRTGATVGVLATALLLVMAGINVGRTAESARTQLRQQVAQVELLARQPLDSAIVLAADRHDYYPLAHASALLARRMRYPVVPDSAVYAAFGDAGDSAHQGDAVRFERDLARIQQELYGIPQLIDLAALQQADRIYLAGNATRRFASLWLPRHHVVDLGSGVFLATRETR